MKESERALMWFTQVSLLGPELAGEPGRLTWNRVQSEGGWIWTSLSDPLGEYETLRKRLYFSNLTFRYFLIAGTQRRQVISCTRNFMQTPVSKDVLKLWCAGWKQTLNTDMGAPEGILEKI